MPSVAPPPAFAGTRTTILTSTITIDATTSLYSFGYPYPPQNLPTSYSILTTTFTDPSTTIELSIPYLVLTEVVGVAVHSDGAPVITNTIAQHAPSELSSLSGASVIPTSTSQNTQIHTLTQSTSTQTTSSSGSTSLTQVASTQTSSTSGSATTASTRSASKAPTKTSSPNPTSALGTSKCSGFSCWPTGQKVGIILGVLIFAFAIGGVIWWGLLRKRKHKKNDMHSARDVERGGSPHSHRKGRSRRGPQPSWAGRPSSSSSERLRSPSEDARDKRTADYVEKVAAAISGVPVGTATAKGIKDSPEQRRREHRGKERDTSRRRSRHGETRSRRTSDDEDRRARYDERGRGGGRPSSHSPSRGHSDHKHDNKRSKSTEPKEKEKSRLWGVLPLALAAIYTLCEPKGGGWDQFLSEEKKEKNRVKDLGKKIGDEIIDRHHEHQKKKKRHSQKHSPDDPNNHSSDSAYGHLRPRARSSHSATRKSDPEPGIQASERSHKDDGDPGSSTHPYSHGSVSKRAELADENASLHRRSSSNSPPAPRKRMTRTEARAQEELNQRIEDHFREKFGSSDNRMTDSMLSPDMRELLEREKRKVREKRAAKAKAKEQEAEAKTVQPRRKVEDDFSFRGRYAGLKMSPNPRIGEGKEKEIKKSEEL